MPRGFQTSPTRRKAEGTMHGLVRKEGVAQVPQNPNNVHGQQTSFSTSPEWRGTAPCAQLYPCRVWSVGDDVTFTRTHELAVFCRRPDPFVSQRTTKHAQPAPSSMYTKSLPPSAPSNAELTAATSPASSCRYDVRSPPKASRPATAAASAVVEAPPVGSLQLRTLASGWHADNLTEWAIAALGDRGEVPAKGRRTKDRHERRNRLRPLGAQGAYGAARSIAHPTAFRLTNAPYPSAAAHRLGQRAIQPSIDRIVCTPKP
eukprot:scaffold41682_cov31-Tisochrysis_lutea.AAC.4